MGLWSGIKYALNSTLGTDKFMPLDKMVARDGKTTFDALWEKKNYIKYNSSKGATSQYLYSGEMQIPAGTKQKICSFTVPNDSIMYSVTFSISQYGSGIAGNIIVEDVNGVRKFAYGVTNSTPSPSLGEGNFWELNQGETYNLYYQTPINQVAYFYSALATYYPFEEFDSDIIGVVGRPSRTISVNGTSYAFGVTSVNLYPLRRVEIPKDSLIKKFVFRGDMYPTSFSFSSNAVTHTIVIN